jgi:endoglucanase
MMAFVAAGAAVVVAGAIALAFGRLGGAPPPQARCAGEACPRETSGSAAAPRFRYRTVERDTGYFEGTVTLVNHGAAPLRSWTLTFTYPGADIHNAWEVVLRRTGQNVAIVSAPTAEPIAPGDEFEVRFGGAGRPGMPTNCRFNGTPCTFVR